MEHATGIDQAREDDLSRPWDFVCEDDLGELCIDILANYLIFSGRRLAPPLAPCEGIETAVVGVEKLSPNQFVQRFGNHRIGLWRKPLDPVAGIVRSRCGRDFPQDRVEQRATRGGRIEQGQRCEIGIDAAEQRQFTECRANHCTVEVPAGNLTEIASLFVEQCQQQLFRQTQRGRFLAPFNQCRLSCHRSSFRSQHARIAWVTNCREVTDLAPLWSPL